MKTMFDKVKTEHHILKEFFDILLRIEKHPGITRIIPGRISRQQKGSSYQAFKISYPTTSGIKCVMCKGATAQELFIVCNNQHTEEVLSFLQTFTSGHSYS